jgi:hypothetical protein
MVAALYFYLLYVRGHCADWRETGRSEWVLIEKLVWESFIKLALFLNHKNHHPFPLYLSQSESG